MLATPPAPPQLVAHDPALGLALWRSARPSAAFVAHVGATEWGSAGLKVQSRDAAHELARLGDGAFYEVRRPDDGDRLVATYALVPNTLGDAAARVTSHYRCLLSVAPDAGARGIGSRLSAWVRALHVAGAEAPTLSYGFIDRDNDRSLAVATKNGYRELTGFDCVNIGWSRPRADPRVRPMRADERPIVLDHIRAAARGHLTPDLARGLHDDELWVLEDGGAIVAGTQLVDKRVRVTKLAGPSGRVLMALGPLLARVSRLFELRDRRVPWLCNTFALPGAEPLVKVLYRSLQARVGAHALVTYFHADTPIYGALQRRAAFGPLARIAPRTRFAIMADAAAGAEAHWPRFAAQPWWFSALECV